MSSRVATGSRGFQARGGQAAADEPAERRGDAGARRADVPASCYLFLRRTERSVRSLRGAPT